MRLGALWVTFITVFTSQCDCADLEVLINGMRTTSCVGETVTYVCTVASNTHIWNITGLEDEVTVAGGSNDVEEGVFTIGSDGLTNGILTSYVIVSSFPGLDGVLLRCRDGTGTQGLEEQTTTAMVFGSSSAPRLTVMSMLTSFILTPQAPEDSPQCVTNYNIIPAGDDGVVREDIPVAIEDLGVAILVDGYDVCLYTYNFTIISTTLTGELMRTVSQDDPLDLSDAAPITGLVETRSGLAWSPPANAIRCSFDYVVTEDGSELTRIADTSYDYTFPTCRNLTIIVTPVVPSTGQVLTSSSASINIFISSPDVVGIKPEVSVSSSVRPNGDEVISWILQVVGITADEVVKITRGDDRELVATIPVDGNHEGQYIVIDCDYEETSTTFYVRFISGDCMSEESTAADGFITGLTCTGDRGSGAAGSSVVLTTVVSVVLFIVGVVAGFAAGWLTRHCTGRSKQSTPSPPPAALYEEVVLPTTQRTQVQGELELKDNVAYGHVAL